MSKEHITYRVIGDIRYHCQDTACVDFDRAEYNRYIVTNKLFTTGYILAEEAVERTPLGQPLAAWIPTGRLPQVGKKDWEQSGGDGRRRGDGIWLETAETEEGVKIMRRSVLSGLSRGER